MTVFSKINQLMLDLFKGSPSFLLGSISAKYSDAATVGVRLRRDRRVVVRPGQSDFSTLRQVFRDEEYRLPDQIVERISCEAKRIRASGSIPVLVDAGANIGAASIWFRSRFPEIAIVAIEPDASNAAIARRNISGLRDIVLMEAAIGSEPGLVSVNYAEQGWAVTTERAGAGCPVVTIDQAVAAVPSGKLLVIKIDIEGFGDDLFSSNLGWMDDVFAVYIEPHDWLLPGKGTSRTFQKAFGERDFEIFLQGENLIYVRRHE